MNNQLKAEELYLEAKALIDESDLKKRILGGCGDDLINQIQTRVGVKLPRTFIKYLQDYGVLNIDAEEFYGEWPRDGLGGGIPSFVFATEHRRELGELGEKDVMVRVTGYGPVFVIDTSIVDNDECPVFMQNAQYDRDSDTVSYTREKVADSFGEFFLNEIKLIVGDD